MKRNQEGKEREERISREELIKAIQGLEEIVTAEMPKEWEEEEETDRVKEKIRKKLMGNNGELTRSALYRVVRADRTGLTTFNNALKSLEDDGEIVITEEKTSGKPIGRIRLLRG